MRYGVVLGLVGAFGCGDATRLMSTFADDGDDEIAFMHLSWRGRTCLFDGCPTPSATTVRASIRVATIEGARVVDAQTIFEFEDQFQNLDGSIVDGAFYFVRSQGYIMLRRGIRLSRIDLEGNVDTITLEHGGFAYPSRDGTQIAVANASVGVTFYDAESLEVLDVIEQETEQSTWYRWDDENWFYIGVFTEDGQRVLTSMVAAQAGGAFFERTIATCHDSTTRSSPLSPNDRALGTHPNLGTEDLPDRFFGIDTGVDVPIVRAGFSGPCP